MLWGWGKETIAPDQEGRPNTTLITTLDGVQLNEAGERILGEDGILQKVRSSPPYALFFHS